MKKIILLLACFLLLGQAPTTEKTGIEVRIKRLEDQIELMRKHVKTKQITLPSQGKFNFSTSGNEYLSKVGGGQISFFLGGNEVFIADQDRFEPKSDGQKNLGNSTVRDWGTIYYHTLSQDSGRSKKQNIVIVATDTFKANRLPSPQRYERKVSTDVVEYGLIADECPEEVIAYDEFGNPMIQTNALIAYLIGVVKEQDKRIKQLER